MTNLLCLPELPYRKHTLPNGLDVIVRRQGRLPIVAVNLWYHVGSKDETPRQRGFAHLFEHLMFEGSEHYPGDFFKPLQRLGASINGSTSSDRTNYFEDLPAAHAELALAMESDRMAGLLAALDDKKLRIQKDVVKNEYRQNYANRPYGQAPALLAEATYPQGHPYRWLTIGAMEDVEAASMADVAAFFGRFYVPANASLCLVGDLDEDDALGMADRYFGPIAGGIRAMAVAVPEVNLSTNVDVNLSDRVELDRVYLSWPTCRHFAADDAPLVLLADVLARGRASRLYRSLVVDRQIAQDVSAYQSGRELAGSFSAVVTLRPGKAWAEARDAVDAELAAVADRGVEPAELERALAGRLAGFVYALDNVGGFGGVADRLNAYNVYLGDPGRIVSDFGRYQGVTTDDLREAAARYLAGKPRVCLSVVGRKSTQAHLDRSTPPRPAPAVAYRAPVPVPRRLACGADLWVIPARDLPIVAMTAVFPAGAGAVDPRQAGLASLAADMMDEGTATRSAAALALEAEGMGTSLSASCGWDGSYVAMQCLAPHLAASLDLAVDILRNPSFPEAEWNRVRGQTLAALRAAHDSADNRAYRALLDAVYPAGHPYRLPADGTVETVEGLRREDAIGHHRAHYRPGRAAVVVAGDVDPDQVVSLLDDRLGGWSGSVELPDPVDPPTMPAAPRLLLLDKPGAPQAVVRVGHAGVRRDDPDYIDLLVWNQVLGGQFSSRLNARLREEKGFTYGIRSQFDFRRGHGPFQVSASLQADRLAEALGDLRAEVLDLLTDRPPTAAELDDARRALVEGQARQFETPSSLVSRFAGLHLYGLPPAYHAELPERLAAVTPETARAAAARHVRPESLVYAVVADASAVGPSLAQLGWAEVRPVDDTPGAIGSKPRLRGGP